MAGVSLKLEKVGPIFSSFNLCSPFASVATVDRKQVQVLNNKTGPLIFLELS